MTGAVAGVIVGATAGGADIEAGVFRDLAATGRSRTALFAARLPGAWAIVVPPCSPRSPSARCSPSRSTRPGAGPDRARRRRRRRRRARRRRCC